MKYRTLIRSPYTGLLYGSTELWRHAPTAFEERPERFTLIHDDALATLHERFGDLMPVTPGEWIDNTPALMPYGPYGTR